MLGHSDQDCGIVYDNSEKEIARAYGTWLREPSKNKKNQNLGAKWLRNGVDSSTLGVTEGGKFAHSTTAHGEDNMWANFMEVDG